ncbi:hypothetical protein LTR22_024483, partial [Elasticomyces elasticus]
SLAPENMAAQVDLVLPLAGRSPESFSESAAGSLLLSLESISGANRLFQTSVHESHTKDDPAGEPTPALPRPESHSLVSLTVPAEPHPDRLFPMQPAVLSSRAGGDALYKR